ncbi:hypothetical protein GA0115260_117432 [Streptomyces sp. MnatMP-M27]|nr:hypothetical protein GA0115260_117432 [Streptomyces sp. MnatMP-M27]
MDRAMGRCPGIPSGLLVPDGIRGDGNTATGVLPSAYKRVQEFPWESKEMGKSPGQLPYDWRALAALPTSPSTWPSTRLPDGTSDGSYVHAWPTQGSAR